jgi:hypothetical protein
LPHWVNNTLVKLRPTLKESIKSSCLKDGLLEEILKDEFQDLCRTLNKNQPLPEHEDSDDEHEQEDEEHGLQYEDEDDDGVFVMEETENVHSIVTPTTRVTVGESGTGGKFVLKMKCCCGRNDNYHNDNIPSGVKMDHKCNRCKKPCYGLCTEDYVCYKCLYM